MFDLTHPSPSVGAFKAHAMIAEEVDAHPDCDRIWATIQEVRGSVAEEVRQAQADAETASGTGYDEGFATAKVHAAAAVSEALDEMAAAADAASIERVRARLIPLIQGVSE